MLHYVFGYGSLVNKDSREKTVSTNTVFPCYLTGNYSRFWTYHPIYKEEIILGVASCNYKNSMNGILMLIDDDGLTDLDKREYGYTRVKTPLICIESVTPLEESYTIWIYLLHRDNIEPVPYDIKNSRYVTICMEGYLKYGNDFLREFMDSTDGWLYEWMNVYVETYKKIC